jgi:hypothetical protein
VIPVLTAAVVVLAAITVLNLAVTLAVVRRLREMPAAAPANPGAVGGPAPGEVAPEFSAVTVDGTGIEGPALRRRTTLVGFFNTSCESCGEAAPDFAAAAADLNRAGMAALAIVEIVDGDDPTEFTARLGPDATVVVEPGPGDVLKRYLPKGTPAFYLVNAEGVVISRAFSVGACMMPVRAGVDA